MKEEDVKVHDSIYNHSLMNKTYSKWFYSPEYLIVGTLHPKFKEILEILETEANVRT